jgi:hypothetical protein
MATMCLVALLSSACGNTDQPELTGNNGQPQSSKLLSDQDLAAERTAEKQRELQGQQLQEQLVVAKVKRQRAIENSNRVLTQFSAAETEVKQWDAEIRPLLTNERGKQLAGNDEAVAAFQRVYEKERPGRGEVDAARVRVSQLIEPVVRASEETEALYVPGEALMKQLEEEGTIARNLTATYRDARAQIQVLLMQNDHASPSNMTLQAALDARRLNQAQATLEADKERQQNIDAEIEKKKVEAAELQKQIEVDRIQQEMNLQVTKAQAERDTREREAAAAQLSKDANDPTILAKFRPFLDRGWYLGGESLPHNEKPRPWSYRYLQSFGVTTNYDRFVQAATDTRDRARQRWPKPDTPEEDQEYHKRFDQFVQLAPIWRDAGKLDP